MATTFLTSSAKPGFLGTQLAAAKRAAKPSKMSVVPRAVLKAKVRAWVGIVAQCAFVCER